MHKMVWKKGKGQVKVKLKPKEIKARNADIVKTIAAQKIETRVLEAKAELLRSDMVAIRCMKAGKVFPADWKAYVKSLRSVVKGTSKTIPKKPKFPQGT